jgi:hypothetical protein
MKPNVARHRFVLILADDEYAALRERAYRDVAHMSEIVRSTLRRELGLPEEQANA